VPLLAMQYHSDLVQAGFGPLQRDCSFCDDGLPTISCTSMKCQSGVCLGCFTKQKHGDSQRNVPATYDDANHSYKCPQCDPQSRACAHQPLIHRSVPAVPSIIYHFGYMEDTDHVRYQLF
jgi:hypothetical protein